MGVIVDSQRRSLALDQSEAAIYSRFNRVKPVPHAWEKSVPCVQRMEYCSLTSKHREQRLILITSNSVN